MASCSRLGLISTEWLYGPGVVGWLVFIGISDEYLVVPFSEVGTAPRVLWQFLRLATGGFARGTVGTVVD